MRNGPYTLVLAPDNYPGKKFREKYCYEHQLVYWTHFGIITKVNENNIHHINGNKRDNRIENLQLLTASQHSRYHGEQNKVLPITVQCTECGTDYQTIARNYRHKQRKGQKNFCSRRCIGLYQFPAKSL